MGKLLTRRLMVIATAVAAPLLGTSPVVAASTTPTTWTVSNPNGDGTFSFADAALVLRNTDTGDVISCSTVVWTDGELKSGTYQPDPAFPDRPVDFGKVDAEYQCSDARGVPVTVWHAGPWSFMPESHDPDAARTTGRLHPSTLTAFYVARPECDYFVQGWFEATPGFTLSNSTSTLTVSASTQLFGVRGAGCDGVAHEDDSMTYAATYTITPLVTIVGS